jgi:hypothetical protein
MHIYYVQSVEDHNFKFGSYRTNIWKLFQVKCGQFAICFSTVQVPLNSAPPLCYMTGVQSLHSEGLNYKSFKSLKLYTNLSNGTNNIRTVI